ncbi:hypothetical protein MMC09_003124 [Bachmanniomyces sp. S44760]|nr:hypothetical protein [Bachmanniomyces sp. S44760]
MYFSKSAVSLLQTAGKIQRRPGQAGQCRRFARLYPHQVACYVSQAEQRHVPTHLDPDNGQLEYESLSQPPGRDNEPEISDKRWRIRYTNSSTGVRHEGDETIRLDINALGEPGEIRVLNGKAPGIDWIHMTIPTGQTNVESGMDPSEILQGIDSERGIVNTDIFVSNIEEIRENLMNTQDSTGANTIAQYDEAVQRLHDGFLIAQLLHYIKGKKPEQNSKSFELRSGYSSEIYQRSEWFPGNSAFPSEAVRRLQSSKDRGQTESDAATNNRMWRQRKAGVVDRLVKSIWKIRIREDEVQIGELDIALQPNHLQLLLKHRLEYLKRLSERYGAKLDVSISRSIVRFHADYATCCDMTNLLEVMLNSISYKDLDLQPLQKEKQSVMILNQAMNDWSSVEQIERLTSTILRPEHANRSRDTLPSHIRIYFVGPESTDAADATRLLLQFLKPPREVNSQVTSEYRGESTAVLCPVEVSTALPWSDRNIEWFRWRNPSQKFLLHDSDDRHQAQQAFDSILMVLSPDSGESLSSGNLPDLGESWQDQPTTSITATIGQILTDKSVDDEGTAKLFPGKSDESRVMVSSIPRIQPILQRCGSTVTAVKQELHIRLSPVIGASSNLTESNNLPELVLRVTVDEDLRKTHLEEVTLVVREKHVDLLLPEKPVDLRFTSSVSISATNMIDGDIRHFFESCNLDVCGQDRLLTPNGLQLSLPVKAFMPKSATLSKAWHSTPLGTAPVDYAFSSLDHRSHISMDFRGHTMIYSTIEAGRTGGRRHELKVRMNRRESNSSFTSVDEFGNFFTSIRSSLIRQIMKSLEPLELPKRRIHFS